MPHANTASRASTNTAAIAAAKLDDTMQNKQDGQEEGLRMSKNEDDERRSRNKWEPESDLNFINSDLNSSSLTPATPATRYDSHEPGMPPDTRKQARKIVKPKQTKRQPAAIELLPTSSIPSLTPLEIARIFKILDRDGDGQVTHAEFIKGLKLHPAIASKLRMPADIRAEDGTRESYQFHFAQMDIDGSRTISIFELLSFHGHFGMENEEQRDELKKLLLSCGYGSEAIDKMYTRAGHRGGGGGGQGIDSRESRGSSSSAPETPRTPATPAEAGRAGGYGEGALAYGRQVTSRTGRKAGVDLSEVSVSERLSASSCMSSGASASKIEVRNSITRSNVFERSLAWLDDELRVHKHSASTSALTSTSSRYWLVCV
jgi:Ca2+-binding EF-hand superfamily protein